MSKFSPFFEQGATIYDKNLQIKYHVKSFLGKGAFAQCYLVQIDSGAEFALKVISTKHEDSVMRKIESEISIHKSLDHPHIVRMYTEFRDDKYVYMVLELCKNKTLNELLKSKKRLDEHYTVKYVNQLIDTLEYLHETAHVVHRDLKLGNLFLDGEFNLKIGDFGLSARIKPGQKKNTICGTPNYIAPEVLFDKENGHSYEVDVWGLGVIIYTLLIGTPPFQKSNVKEIYRNIQQNKFIYPADATISDTAKNLINAILTTNPMDRLSLTEIKNHPFLQQKMSLPEKVYRNLKDFCYVEEECI
ncbi:putative cell cycle serine/threonine-protein kinase CDC5 like protein, partial [Dictyocoela roeselum]